MAEKYAGPNKELVCTPVEELCGSPDKRSYSGGGDATEVYGLKGPEGAAAGLGAEMPLIYNDIKPGGGDKPSDSKQFQGVGRPE